MVILLFGLIVTEMEGNILVGDDNIFNSANGRTGDTDSSGGRITFGGGNNSGVIPNGNAVSSSLLRVKLGTTTAIILKFTLEEETSLSMEKVRP